MKSGRHNANVFEQQQLVCAPVYVTQNMVVENNADRVHRRDENRRMTGTIDRPPRTSSRAPTAVQAVARESENPCSDKGRKGAKKSMKRVRGLVFIDRAKSAGVLPFPLKKRVKTAILSKTPKTSEKMSFLPVSASLPYNLRFGIRTTRRHGC